MSEKRLSWQPGFSLSRKPVRKVMVRRHKRRGLGDANGSQQFEFICEYPGANLESERSLSDTLSHTTTGPSVDPAIDHLANSDAQTSPGVDGAGLLPGSPTPFFSHEPGSPAWIGAFDDTSPSAGVPHRVSSNAPQPEDVDSPQPEETERTGDSNERAVQAAPSRPHLMTVAELPCTMHPEVNLPLTSIMYNNISHRFEPILDRYNQEFCKIPLTFDLLINPFQYRAGRNPEPLFLVHAVVALAGHHVQSRSTQQHRHTALHLLRESLGTSVKSGDVYNMLNAIIILFSLDETQSALGNWSIHLVGARALLEALGGIEKWNTSPRAVAQVGMLTWWDAITSLVSREDCVFPYAYFEAVISNHNEHDWDYFRLCGCPRPLVEIVMRLARLGAEKRQSSSMQYVTFDNASVSEIEKSLEVWQHVSPLTAYQDEESMQYDQDAMHCSEAWRNGLFVYMHRVFHWEPGSSIPIHVLSRARVVADHIFACRDDSMIARQALLPLVFAGCELRDESIRKKILKYCTLWNDKTRYHMFNSAIPLLEGVWAEQEKRGAENVWWGQVVDKQHMAESHYPLQIRLCFG